VYPDLGNDARATVPFAEPFTSFCTATVRAGNRPSNIIDVFGNSTGGNVLSYGRVVIK
jgi:hypothetical protein